MGSVLILLIMIIICEYEILTITPDFHYVLICWSNITIISNKVVKMQYLLLKPFQDWNILHRCLGFALTGNFWYFTG